MAPRFGTSGLRGLASELSDALVADHVRAFLNVCATGSGLWVGRDLRDSSPRIGGAIIAATRGEGIPVTDCGATPTPALAMAAMEAGAAAIMVTGSHIPADRNGIKFYTPAGEIGKADELAIIAALGLPPGAGDAPLHHVDPGPAYIARYVNAFGVNSIAGMRVGVYSHSAVGRDLLLEALASLGAETVELGRADVFVPVDTEAVDAKSRSRLIDWARRGLDAIVSTDGDGDRPLLADAAGRIVPGDILGQITARTLGAETVVTPVSSNSGVEAGGRFRRVLRTRIGSPHVIAGMEAAGGRVVGYEANGGFLLGFSAQGPAGPLAPLMTRDSLLPLIATLHAARERGGLAALVADEPARFTAADRLEETPPEHSTALLDRLSADPAARAALLAPFGAEATLDQTDGLRVTLANGRIVHLRPSGNAPEFRVYVEAETATAAETLLAGALERVRKALG